MTGEKATIANQCHTKRHQVVVDRSKFADGGRVSGERETLKQVVG